jgi:hypothetical protein
MRVVPNRVVSIRILAGIEEQSHDFGVTELRSQCERAVAILAARGR